MMLQLFLLPAVPDMLFFFACQLGTALIILSLHFIWPVVSS